MTSRAAAVLTKPNAWNFWRYSTLSRQFENRASDEHMFTDTQRWSFWQERCLISSQESSCFVERLYHSVHTFFSAITITCNITSLSSQNHELFLSRLVHLHRQISCFGIEIFVPNQRVFCLALQHLWLIGVDHKVMKKAKNGAVFQTREEVEEEDHAR